MEPYSNSKPTSTPSGAAAARAKAEPPGSRSPQSIVSAALAVARATASKAPDTALRVPAQSGGTPLAEMAQRDLDAALQLLAERAQYITGAKGAAIALRGGAKNDLICRASTSGSAVELGALLSTEFGLSGESVKARQALCCDDTSLDQRVNRQICRQLGIASVMVMPVVQDDQVLGVFELFSGKVRAFSERDLSALQRLSGMVETAVKLAQTPDQLAERLKTAEPAVLTKTPEVTVSADPRVRLDAEAPKVAEPESPAEEQHSGVSHPPVFAPEEQEWLDSLLDLAKGSEQRKPALWSAAHNTGAAAAPRPADSVESHVPPVLRNQAVCGACGFPVSPGRELCVECEEKQWRGQLKPTPRVAPTPLELVSAPRVPAIPEIDGSKQVIPHIAVVPSSQAETVTHISPPARPQSQQQREFVLSAGLEPRKSSANAWLSMNKYVVVGLLAVAGVLLVILILR